MILALSLRCAGDPVWEDGSMSIYKIVLSSLNRQASDKMHSSRLHLREGPMVPASLRPGPLSPCPSARAGALSRSPVSLYLLAGRVRDAGFTRCARSSTDRVADFESEGCRFESYRARFRLSPNQPEDRRQVPSLARLVDVRAPVGHFRRSDGNRINPAVSVPSVRQIFGKAFSYGFAIGPRGACRLRACRGLERVWESLHGPHNVVKPGVGIDNRMSAWACCGGPALGRS